jgi:rhodanese-related sulfurtransferase
MDGEISAEDLKVLLDADEDVTIVDIRSRLAYDHGHIPGSVSIPFAELTRRVDELEGANRVVTVCPHGKASVQAARLIGSYEGFSGVVESLAPGIDNWPYGVESGGGEGAGAKADGGDEGPSAPF